MIHQLLSSHLSAVQVVHAMGKCGHCCRRYETAGKATLRLNLRSDRQPSDTLSLFYSTTPPPPQSVRSWAEYLEYDREGKDGDPSLVGGFTSVIRLLLQRMGVVL